MYQLHCIFPRGNWCILFVFAVTRCHTKTLPDSAYEQWHCLHKRCDSKHWRCTQTKP